jgi:hypothetical protein
VLVEIAGKGNGVRSVAVPAWVKAAIDAWAAAAGVTEGKIFRVVLQRWLSLGKDLTLGRSAVRAMGLENWRHTTCAAPALSSAASAAANSSKRNSCSATRRFRPWRGIQVQSGTTSLP